TVNTGTDTITGVQIEAAYDPTVLTNVQLTPGPFFTNANVIINKIDTKNGRISYVIGIQPAGTHVQGQCIAAVIHYSVLSTTTVSSTTISFQPKTFVSVEGTSDTALQKFTDITLQIAK